jgi:hypothetical protein
MSVLQLVLYIAGLVLLILAGINVGHPRVNLGWLGMACWLTAYAILPAIR